MRTRLLGVGTGLVDRAVLPWMQVLWRLDGDPHSPAQQREQERARETYTAPELLADPRAFFVAPDSPRVEIRARERLRGGRRERYSWRSGYRTRDPDFQGAYDEDRCNAIVQAEGLRHDGSGHPTLICVHSWATGIFPLQRLIFRMRALYRQGLDVVLLILPFHGPRSPRRAHYGGQLFPGSNPRRTNEAFGQAIWDLRGLLEWLLEQGSGPVGVMGQSLGGYISALLGSVEPRISCCIPMVPMVSLGDLMWELGAGSSHRRRAEERGISVEDLRELYQIHCPLRHQPLVPRERRLIIAGRGDAICRPAHIEMLYDHWQQPEICWFAGSHMIHLGCGPAFEAVVRLVQDSPHPVLGLGNSV